MKKKERKALADGKQRFPLRLVVEAMKLGILNQAVAPKVFTSRNKEIMALVCHVLPDYSQSPFPYMLLPKVTQETLRPNLEEQFPAIAKLDVSDVSGRDHWKRLLGHLHRRLGKEVWVQVAAVAA